VQGAGSLESIPYLQLWPPARWRRGRRRQPSAATAQETRCCLCGFRARSAASQARPPRNPRPASPAAAPGDGRTETASVVRRRRRYHRQNPRLQRLRPTRRPAGHYATGAGSSARGQTRRCAAGAGAAACGTRRWRRRPDEKAASRGVEGAGAEAAAAAAAAGCSG
jgi:hypothetical protein